MEKTLVLLFMKGLQAYFLSIFHPLPQSHIQRRKAIAQWQNVGLSIQGSSFRTPSLSEKRFAYILWKGVFFLASGQGGSSPVLPFRPWLRKANPLESLKVGYWGRITTDNPSLRDRVYDQRVKQRSNIDQSAVRVKPRQWGTLADLPNWKSSFYKTRGILRNPKKRLALYQG